jgi:hypothetical protein
MSHTPVIAQHLDRPAQPRQRQVPFDLRKHGLGLGQHRLPRNRLGGMRGVRDTDANRDDYPAENCVS